jgi:hypothetical protein
VKNSNGGMKQFGKPVRHGHRQVPDPNGILFSPDHKKLYVISTCKGPGDTGPGGKGVIYVFDVGVDNKLSNQKLFTDCVVDGVKCGPDGMRCDVNGNVWCSSNAGRAIGYSGVTVWSPEGKLIGRIRIPEICGNVCFGGPKRNRTFMAASQRCMPFTRRLRERPQAERTWRQRAEGAVSALPVSRAADVLSRRYFVAMHRNGKPSGVIEAGRHCLPHAVCRTAVQEDKPTLRGHRECVEFDRERNSPFFNRFSAGNRPRHRCPRFVENDPYAIDNAQQSECPQPGQALPC